MIFELVDIQHTKFFSQELDILRLKKFIYSMVMEKAMAPHSSTLAWKIPWIEQPGGLQSVGSLRVGHD